MANLPNLMRDSKGLRHYWIAGVVLLIGVFLYFVFRTSNYDPNDIIEVQAVENGGDALISPNHILFRPLIAFLYMIAQALGYRGQALIIGQIFVIGSAAIGLVLCYLWVSSLVRSRWLAIIVTLGFGTSWAYWVYSIGSLYFIPTATFSLGALVVLWRIIERPSNAPLSLSVEGQLGFLTALSVLFWQANIFFIPVIIGGLILKYRGQMRKLYISTFIYLIALSIPVGIVYIYTSLVSLGDNWSIPSLLDWLLNYNSAQLQSWGTFSWERTINVIPTWISSILPIWEGMGLRDLFRGQIRPEKLFSQLSLIALILLIIIPVVLSIRCRFDTKRLSLLAFFAFGFLIYYPFIIWWDPTEPLWFVLPNIFFWGALAVAWEPLAHNSYWKWLATIMIFVIGAANFVSAIWPRHANPNHRMQIAECVSQHVGMNDIYISKEWDWTYYLEYFYQRDVIYLIDLMARLKNTDAVFELVSNRIEHTKLSGGQTYTSDQANVSADWFDWLLGETGLTRMDFERFEVQAAFRCGELQYHFVTGIQTPSN